ncbi:hypothetical protein D3C79_845560 [compost metagenome]
MEKYVIVMGNGTRVSTTNVNLEALTTMFNKNNTLAAVIGSKSMVKHTVVAVAKMETINESEKNNMVINVGDISFYTTVEYPRKTLEALTDDINNNKKHFVLVNGEILINRNGYQYAEILEDKTETQANA